MTFRVPKPWVLQETETSITTFCNWQSNILFHLSSNNDFATFLPDEFTWQKKSVQNRGLIDDVAPIPQADRKTAIQKNMQLEMMLGIIAQFCPPLLRNDIVKNSTSIKWIWSRIRRHFSFMKSEVHFLKLHDIKREPNERYETLYQRIVAHMEDNLLTVESGMTHDGAVLTADEEISPTVERVAVYLWLQLIDARLPAYISRVYAHDLQRKSLKDIQPQICDSMDSLLSEMAAQDEVNVNYSRSNFNNRGRFTNDTRSRPQQRRPVNNRKQCALCKASGRSY